MQRKGLNAKIRTCGVVCIVDPAVLYGNHDQSEHMRDELIIRSDAICFGSDQNYDSAIIDLLPEYHECNLGFGPACSLILFILT